MMPPNKRITVSTFNDLAVTMSEDGLDEFDNSLNPHLQAPYASCASICRFMALSMSLRDDNQITRSGSSKCVYCDAIYSIGLSVA